MTAKGDTNRKWVSTDNFRDNYDRIFGAATEPCACDTCLVPVWLREIGCICRDNVNGWKPKQQTRGK